MVDWAAALWPASYKGVPFRVEKDTAPDGRRLVVHEFPNRDLPFVEDLGRKAGSFDVTAYVAGDAALVSAQALRALARQRGAGPLILPLDGPVRAHLQDIKRAFEKDKLGFVAFDLTFVREGAAGALASVLSLAQLVFDAADRAVAALADFANHIVTAAAPGLAVEAALDALSTLPATLEATRAEATITSESSLAISASLSARLAAAPAAISTSGVDPGWIVSAAQDARDLADAMQPADVEPAFAEAAAGFSGPIAGGAFVGVTAALEAAANQHEAARYARAALLIARAEAMAHRAFADRPAALAARAAILTDFSAELHAAADQRDEDAYDALRDLRDRLTDWFGLTIADLRPVVAARLPRSLPATVVCWSLYGALDRLDDLAARNRVRHPGYMPTTVEAVAP